MPTAREIYDAEVSGLPPSERVQLAALILDDLSKSIQSGGFSLAWTDEDLADAVAYSLQHADN